MSEKEKDAFLYISNFLGVLAFYEDGTFKLFDKKDFKLRKEREFDSFDEKAQFIEYIIEPVRCSTKEKENIERG